MSRLFRITYLGAIYHIINRGIRKDRIFRRKRDKELFLSRMFAVGALLRRFEQQIMKSDGCRIVPIESGGKLYGVARNV